MKTLFPRRLLIATAALACLSAGYAQAQNIRIGFQVPLTGPAASDGKTALQGAQLAVEQINAAGGIKGRPLELVPLDDQTQPAQALEHLVRGKDLGRLPFVDMRVDVLVDVAPERLLDFEVLVAVLHGRCLRQVDRGIGPP